MSGDYTEGYYDANRDHRGHGSSSGRRPRVENHYYEGRGGYGNMDHDGGMRHIGNAIDSGFRDQNRQFDEAYREHNRSLDRIERRQQDSNRFMLQAAISMSIVIIVLFIVLILSYWG